MKESDLLDRLAEVNPAPRRELSGLERAQKAALRQRLVVDHGGAIPVRSDNFRRRWVTGAFAGLLALGAVFAFVFIHPTTPTTTQALGVGSLTAADLAGWVSSPHQLSGSSRAEQACAGQLSVEPLSSGPVSVSNADIRGIVTSAIVSQGRYSAWCVAGSDPEPLFLLLNSPQYVQPTPAADSIFIGPSGTHLAPGGYSFAEGTVGASVKSVTLHENGLSIVATVENGQWTAWWPSNDSDGSGYVVKGQLTVGLADGTQVSYAADQVRLH
jgi:hypothetical protein